MNKTYSILMALIVSLGGFLFGFDAGIISGVMEFAASQFNLSNGQIGQAVSSPSFAAMFAMLISGRVSDIIGRKKMLQLVVAFLYVVSALSSAYASSYTMLWVARMIGGVAFGAALILAPVYIAEISRADNRGKLVSIQQLNIVLGFFAAFLSNYYLNQMNSSGFGSLNSETVWRWMLGVEMIPAVLYFVLLFFVPESPRWLYLKSKTKEALYILQKLHGETMANEEGNNILQIVNEERNKEKVWISEIFKPALRFIMIVGLVIGVVCYYNIGHHFYLCMMGDEVNRKTYINLIRNDHFATEEFLLNYIEVSQEKIHLKVIWQASTLQFFYSVNEVEWIKVGANYNTEILSDDYVREGSDRYRPAFTGSFVGVTCNDLTGAGIWAKFKYLEYKEL